MRTARILLIADNSAEGQTFLSHLHANYRVIKSQEKSESFAAALVERPDLIVADLDLPDRIGFETIEMLRKHPSLGETPIIGLSDNRKRSDVLAAVRVGVNDYLIKKETNADSLLQKVESWLKMLNQIPDEPGQRSGTDCLTEEEAQREDPQLCLTDAIIEPLLRYAAKDEEFFYSDRADSAQNQLSMKDWINPFIVHTANVFRKMLGWSLQRQSVDLKDSYVPTHDVSGVISMTGQANGTAVLSLSRRVAFKVVNVILDKKVSQLNEDVMDAVGELTNIISGRASGDLENYKTKIGLPSVLIGRTKVAPFPQGLKPICIAFECPGGPLTLEVGLELPSASETKLEAAASP